MEEKQAGAVKKGDIIVNVGVVDREPARYGVFIVFSVRGTVWSLAKSTGDVYTRDLVMHEADTVVVE